MQGRILGVISSGLRGVFVGVLLVSLGAVQPAAQGLDGYCNFEAPQVKPIAVASIVAGLTTRYYVFACNTPDNSIEVYDITGSLRDDPSLVARIPVGLEPVSVVYKRLSISGVGTRNMLYSVNWLGDSVTFVEITVNPTSFNFNYTVTREVRVTEPREVQGGNDFRADDEPMHLAVVNRAGNAGQFLVVTKRGASSYSMLHPFTGEFMTARNNSGTEVSGAGRNVIMTAGSTSPSTSDGQVIFGESPDDYSGIRLALKQPHTVAWRPGTDQFYVLGHKGGGSDQTGAFGYDFDLWGIQMPAAGASGTNTYFSLGSLGTTNFNMAFDSAGDFLYVVGTRAEDDITGNGNLLKSIFTRTGFARTMLFKVDMTDGSVDSRDLNLRFTGPPAGVAVDGATTALTQCTDVAMYKEPGTNKNFACVAGFDSSRFGMVYVDDADPKNWAIDTVTVESTTTSETTLADPPRFEAGPRGVAVLSSGTAANDRAYLLNRLDCSISVIKLNGGDPVFMRQFALDRPDVEPAYIRAGRKFLYSTKFSGPGTSALGSSTTAHGLEGFASCASCHIDGRSDHVSWRLTAKFHDPDNATPLENPLASSVMSPKPDLEEDAIEILNPTATTVYADGIPSDVVIDSINGGIPADDANAKGPMFTQSLQGLSNFEVGGTRIVSGGVATSTDFFADEDDAASNESGTDDDAADNPFDDLISNAPYHWRGDKDTFRHFNEAFVNLMGMNTASGSIPEGGLSTSDMKAFEHFINSIHYPPNPNEPEDRVYSGDMWTDPDDADSGASEAKRGLQAFHIVPLNSQARSCVQCHMLPEGSNNRITEDNGDPEQPIEATAIRGVVQKDAVLKLSPELATITSGVEQGIACGDFGLAHTGQNPGVKSLNGFILSQFDLTAGQKHAVTEYVREFDTGVAPIVGLSFTVTDTSDPDQTDELNRVDELEIQAEHANCGIAVYARVKVSSTWYTRGYWYDVTHNAYKQVGTSTFLSQIDLLGLLGSGETDDLLIFRGTPLGSDRRDASFALTSPDLPDGTIGVPSSIHIVGTTPNDANELIPLLSANWDPLVDFGWTGTIPLSLASTLAFQIPIGVFVTGTTHRRHDAPRRLQVTGTGLQPGAKLRLILPNVASATGPDDRNVELPLYPTAEFTEDTELRIWETDAEFDPKALYEMILGGPADVAVDETLRRDVTSPTGTLTLTDIRVQAANLPYTSWSTVATVPFNYPKVP